MLVQVFKAFGESAKKYDLADHQQGNFIFPERVFFVVFYRISARGLHTQASERKCPR